jgi:hypothetical protein
MSVNFQKLAPIIGGCFTIGTMIFQMGKQSQNLDTICMRVEAQEKKYEFNNDKVCDIHGNVNVLKNDISNIKEDIKDIKKYIEKKK